MAVTLKKLTLALAVSLCAAASFGAEPLAQEKQAVTVGNGTVPVRIVRKGGPRHKDNISGDVAADPSLTEPINVGTELSADHEVPQDLMLRRRNMASLTGSEVGLWSPRYRAACVLSAGALMDSASREELLDKFVKQGFKRLLLSFDLAAVKGLRSQDGAARQLADFIASATQRELVTDLLLEVAHWNDEKTSAELKEGLQFFEPLAFNAVCLDLGTEMLPESSEERRAACERLAAMLHMALADVRRPLGITVPPQLMEGDFNELIAKSFYTMDLDEIAIKIYSTDAGAVARQFQTICRTYPELPFSLVQSVESSRPRTESYFTASVPIFEKRMQKLCFDVAAGNALDLIVRSWEDYSMMVR